MAGSNPSLLSPVAEFEPDCFSIRICARHCQCDSQFRTLSRRKKIGAAKQPWRVEYGCNDIAE